MDSTHMNGFWFFLKEETKNQERQRMKKGDVETQEELDLKTKISLFL